MGNSTSFYIFIGLSTHVSIKRANKQFFSSNASDMHARKIGDDLKYATAAAISLR